MPVTAVQILNNHALPFFEKHRVKVRTILSDNGRENCDRPDKHPYEPFLQLEERAVEAFYGAIRLRSANLRGAVLVLLADVSIEVLKQLTSHGEENENDHRPSRENSANDVSGRGWTDRTNSGTVCGDRHAGGPKVNFQGVAPSHSFTLGERCR